MVTNVQAGNTKPWPAERERVQELYAGEIRYVDANIARVLATLKELGLYQRALIVFASDHGEQLGDQGLIEKLGFFEASYQVPAIVRDPHHPEQHGTVVDRFTENVDIMPTLASMIGVPVQPGSVDGRCLADVPGANCR